MSRVRGVVSIIVILLAFMSCKKNDIGPENIFTKIYSDPNSNISYYPLDLVQAGTNGYYILGATAIDTTRTWLNTYVASVDEEGEILWEAKIEEPYVSPVADFVNLNGEYFIFCMDNIALTTHVLRVDEGGQTASHFATIEEVTYPLAVSKTPDNGVILLGYDRYARSSTLNKLDASFNLTWQTSFKVNEDAEGILNSHLIKTGTTLPFFTGTIGAGNATHYYANGLYNYTLSLCFVEASSGDITGVAQGYRYAGGTGSFVHLQGSTFALSRFNYGVHFILPSANVDINSISHISDLGGGQLNEIAADAGTKVKLMKVKDKDAVVFATNTNNNQVVIYAYDLVTNELLVKKYLGFSFPVKVGSIIQTADGGIAVLAQTMVTGRFKRTVFYKIPKEHL